jgi:hypothetical protein
MLGHLRVILEQSYPEQLARTGFANTWGRNVTPNDVLETLQEQCARRAFQFNYEGGSKAISQCLADMVYDIYHVLTGQELEYRAEQCTSFSQVASDFSYRVGNGLHILGEDKSPKVFNHFIGELMGQMRDGSSAPLCFESIPTTYNGYKAILGKVHAVASVSRLLSESCHLYL